MIDLQMKCLSALDGLTQPDGEMCVAFKRVESMTGLDRKTVRRSIRALAQKGLAEFHTGLCTEDGEFAGAGYCISVAGRDYFRKIRQPDTGLCGAEEPIDGKSKLRACRVCGCTDDDCSVCVQKTGTPCYWVEGDLCSACQVSGTTYLEPQMPVGWSPPESVPEDGREFEYLCSDGKIRVGSLGHDMGGSIKRDTRMIGWRWPARGGDSTDARQ